MKLKFIFFCFTVLTLSTAIVGLWLYYDAQKTAGINENRTVSISRANAVKDSFLQLISRYQDITLSLSRHRDVFLALTRPSPENLEHANHVLDIYNSSLKTSACYLLNNEGVTIASSNRNAEDSFVGKDYGFRPYFENAIRGKPFVYLALGVTSGVRGIYFSNPVYDETGSVAGVVVIKDDVSRFEDELLVKHRPPHAAHDSFVFIIDDNGVIFISDHHNLLYHTMWKAEPADIETIASSKQFGKGPWPWAGFRKIGEEAVVGPSERSYDLILYDLEKLPGWKIAHLSDSNAISAHVVSSLFETAGYIFIFISIVIILVLLILNSMAVEAEKSLSESEAKLSHIVMGNPVPSFVIDDHHRITHWNKALENITGILASEVVQTDKQWMAFYPEKRPVMADLIVDGGTEDQLFSYYGKRIRIADRATETYAAEDFFPHMAKEGRWLFFTAAPLRNLEGEIIGAVEVLQDITSQKKFEQTLRESESRYRSLFESANDAILVLQDGRIFDCNPRALSMFKGTKEQIIGKHPHELSPDYQPDGTLSRSRAFDLLNKVSIDWVQVFHWQHQSFDGSLIDTEVNLNRLALADESYLLAIVRDITERVRAQEALRKSDRRLQLALDSVSDAVWDWRVDTGEVYFSSRWYTMLDYEPYELPQEYETWKNLLHPEDRSTTEKTVVEHIQSGEPFKIEFRMRTKDDQWRWILARGKTVETDEQGKPVRMLGTHMDITERKEMEARIRQNQKMEAIGTLAGGIAHDFNNILSGIFGYAQLLQIKSQLDDESKMFVDSILDAGQRAKELVQQILTFSRQNATERRPVKVHLIIKEALKLIQATLPTTISIAKKIDNCGMVLADPTQIHQIAMNLCTNAYHAMETSGGELTVTLCKVELTEDSVHAKDHPPGDYARLTVADTGTGIDRQVLPLIFDPYFTTKGKGKGTGLGLSVIHGIVKANEGYITLESEPGIGSRFHVHLPIVADLHKQMAPTTPMPLQKGDETILLVDDQAEVLETGKQMLEALGYRVIPYQSSLEALKAFRLRPHDVDLVITDMTMPNMTGDILSSELSAIRPDIPVILCTGYNETVSEPMASSTGIRGVLLKPVSIHDLAALIRRVMDTG
jgi:PAS domain S-box-containing protein